MGVRRLLGRVVVTTVAAGAILLGSWLLVADPGLGRSRLRPRARSSRLVQAIRPRTHGYGGYARACRPANMNVISTPEGFIRGGNTRCFSSNGNPTGDNADKSTEAFIADSVGTVTNMTRDVRRCVEGANEGRACATNTDCPDGSCQDLHVGDCVADSRGRVVFFVFDGNPTGENPDLGDELFRYDVGLHQLRQLTNQRGWCNGDPSKPCDRSADCGLTDRCVRAQLSAQRSGGYGYGYGGTSTATGGVVLTADGLLVWFLSNGDPAGTNPGHSPTLFVLPSQGGTARRVVSAGGFCVADSANHGQACVTDADCGAICGDGRIDPPEQCDPEAQPTGCPSGQYCVSPFSVFDQCTCRTAECGNGVIEPGEICDPPGSSTGKVCRREGLVCSSDCRSCVQPQSPSGAFP